MTTTHTGRHSETRDNHTLIPARKLLRHHQSAKQRMASVFAPVGRHRLERKVTR